MNTNYDQKLMENEFYSRFHPEYLPYVGDNYDKTKILLCGESNYIDDSNSDLSDDVLRLIESPEWYTTDSRDSEKLPSEGCIDWCQNRDIIVSCLRDKKNGDSIPRSFYMYINPAKVFLDVFPQIGNSWDAFTYFASMNYYQKPARKTGKSIEPTQFDNQFAVDNLCRVVKVLKPETIIFLSKKSFLAFKDSEPEELKDMYIGVCAHPTCAWWNRDDGRHGREVFKNIIKERVSIILP
ncbi:MAG: hypothetical protein ACOH15_04275 [Acetobacterium sp.]